MRLDFSGVIEYWPIFAKGLLLTLAITGLALAMALALGVAAALLRLSRNRLVVGATGSVVEVIRDLPFMVILLLMFYLLPSVGVQLPAFEVGVLTLGLHEAAYYSEIIRGAILSVPRGQMDSARAVGMSRNQAFRHVIFPQMMGYFLPPATNQAIMVVKDSSILSAITVTELTMSGRIVLNYTVDPIEIFLVISILYWIVCAVLSRGGRWLETRLQAHLRVRPASPPPRALGTAHV